MQKGKSFFPEAIMIMIFSLLTINSVGAQSSDLPPATNGSSGGSAADEPNTLTSNPPREVCYGRPHEFICNEDDFHYRAVDCDELNTKTGECSSGECKITMQSSCQGYVNTFEDYRTHEPRCNACTSIYPPVFKR